MSCARLYSGLSLLAAALALAPAPTLQAQQVIANHKWCDEASGDRDSERFCEVREFTLDPRDLVRVDADPNGGISVEGWDRNEISLLAKVEAWSRSGDPEAMVGSIDVETERVITAEGPRPGRREGWSVSFRLMVPARSNLDLESTNGGIHIEGVEGEMDFRTTNGGINILDLGGRVRGRTTNGGVNVALSGEQWSGEGLDVQTTNGGVVLEMPEGYRATLHTGTVNGAFETDFPITIQGRLRARNLTTDLNGGGPPIRASTTNGSVRIRRG